MNVNRFSNQVFVGLLIIVVGILLLLNTTNVYDTGVVFRWLPSLLIVIGLWRLIASGFTNIFGPVIVIAIGAFVQLLVLGIDAGMLWPIILIIIGLFILFGRSKFRERARSHDIDTVDAIGIFSGSKVNVVSKTFKGGQLTAVMGGVEVDLRHAEIAERPAVIESTAIMGSIEIRVPEGWVVKNDTFAMFGGTEDKRSGVPRIVDNSPDVIVTGTVLFAGLEIKD